MYSFRMSFCVVPRSAARLTPCFSAAAMNIAHRMGAGPLIVMETDTLSSGMPEKSVSMSARLHIATPHLPTSPSAWLSSAS
jgi:hypothetical protein